MKNFVIAAALALFVSQAAGAQVPQPTPVPAPGSEQKQPVDPAKGDAGSDKAPAPDAPKDGSRPGDKGTTHIEGK